MIVNNMVGSRLRCFFGEATLFSRHTAISSDIEGGVARVFITVDTFLARSEAVALDREFFSKIRE